MKDKQELIALAERVEKLEGPDAKVNADILRALGWTEHGFVAFTPSGHKAMVIPDYLGSIDAAMLLVPEGWEWQADTLTMGAERDKHAWFRLHRPDYGEQFEAEAATPALALCAAALRAIASQEGK